MTVEVELSGPLDLHASLRPFARWGDDLLDRWDGQRFLRVLPADDTSWVAARLQPGGTLADPRVVVAGEGTRGAATIAALVPGLFVQPDPGAWAELCERDALVRALDTRYPGVRPVLQTDLLTSLVRAISAQQVNLRWAATIRHRLAERYGVEHRIGGESVRRLDAAAIAAADVADLRALQLTTRKALSVIAVAGAIASRQVTLADLAAADDHRVIEVLDALPGIGRWSAEWFLARTLGRPVVVAGDLGVRKAVAIGYLDGRMPAEDEVRSVTAHWRGSATVAQHVLLHALSEGELPLVAASASAQVDRSS